MRLLQGRPLSERINADTRQRAEALASRGIAPTLAVVSVAIDPAASAYLQRITRAATTVGITVRDVALGRETSEAQLIASLERLGADADVNGILLLTPLPGALDEGHIVDHISIEKDVEGMHPFNVGFLADGRPRFVPSTADAAMEMLRFYEVPLRGAQTVVIGRSTVFGRPVANLLLLEDATVTITHSQTADVARYARDADVIVIGIGRAGYLRRDMIKQGVVIIDAGINVIPNGIVGDVDQESVSAVAAALSPVPGGLGTVTTALLLRNVLTATEHQLGKAD